MPESTLAEILEEAGITYRNCIYPLLVTLCAMVSQVLGANKKLRNTLKQMTTRLQLAEIEPPSSDTGAYSKARQRSPETLLQHLIPETTEKLEQKITLVQQ